MIDIQKQIDYWISGSDEEFSVARTLYNSNKLRHSLFFAHLSLEKIIKALVCQKISDLPPRIHNLVRLLEITEIPLSDEMNDFIIEMNLYNLEGRYPNADIPLPDNETAGRLLEKTGETIKWLKTRLNQ